jgi:6-phosphogluconolactonase
MEERMTERSCRGLVWMTAIFLVAGSGIEVAGQERKGEGGGMTVYVGTYTGPKSKGIYMMRMDPATGALSAPEVAGEVASPSFLTIHPNNKYVYAIGEIDTFQGKKTGAVSAFSIDPASGKLTLLNQQTSGGPGPCYVAVDKTGKVALVANYGGGSIESLPIKDDGSLGEPATFVQHTGERGPGAAEGAARALAQPDAGQ